MARGIPGIGKKAPPFHLAGTAGDWSLAAALGVPLVLYFYPRDNTPGCTTEGRAFAANHAKFRAAGATIVGISPDAVESHRKFSLYGRKFLGVERSTFLIDAHGVLRQEWRKVKVDGHAEAVLAAVKAL